MHLVKWNMLIPSPSKKELQPSYFQRVVDIRQNHCKDLSVNFNILTLRGVIPVVYIRLIGRELYSQVLLTVQFPTY
jgi:hypothetical protein